MSHILHLLFFLPCQTMVFLVFVMVSYCSRLMFRLVPFFVLPLLCNSPSNDICTSFSVHTLLSPLILVSLSLVCILHLYFILLTNLNLLFAFVHAILPHSSLLFSFYTTSLSITFFNFSGCRQLVIDIYNSCKSQ